MLYIWNSHSNTKIPELNSEDVWHLFAKLCDEKIHISHNMLLWLLYHSLLYILQCAYYLHNFIYINDPNYVY